MSQRTDDRVDKLVDGLTKLVDSFEPGRHNLGPMRIFFHAPRKPRDSHQVIVEAGWDNNYGGRIVVDSSKTGKALKVYVYDGEGNKNTPRVFYNDKEVKR